MIDFAKRITVAGDVLVRELDGEAVLLNLDNESYYGLDDVGTVFWTALSHSPSIDEAYQRLLKEFDVEAEQLKSDLQAFMKDLLAQGLIRVHEDAA
jgi:uncharacterized protein YjbK